MNKLNQNLKLNSVLCFNFLIIKGGEGELGIYFTFFKYPPVIYIVKLFYYYCV